MQRDREAQRQRGTEAKRHRGKEAQKQRGTEAQRHRGKEAQRQRKDRRKICFISASLHLCFLLLISAPSTHAATEDPPTVTAQHFLSDSVDTLAVIKSPPRKLIKSLRQIFSKEPMVEAAYLGEFFPNGRANPAHLLVGIKTNGNIEKFSAQMIAVCQGNLEDYQFIDFFKLKDDNLSSRMVKEFKPFYQAKSHPRKK